MMPTGKEEIRILLTPIGKRHTFFEMVLFLNPYLSNGPRCTENAVLCIEAGGLQAVRFLIKNKL